MVEEKVNLWWARVKHILQQTCVGLNKWEVLRCKVVLGRMGEGSNGDGGEMMKRMCSVKMENN